MIIFPLGFCGLICSAGIVCLVAGSNPAGFTLIASSWALALGVIYLAWRRGGK